MMWKKIANYVNLTYFQIHYHQPFDDKCFGGSISLPFDILTVINEKEIKNGHNKTCEENSHQQHH